MPGFPGSANSWNFHKSDFRVFAAHPGTCPEIGRPPGLRSARFPEALTSHSAWARLPGMYQTSCCVLRLFATPVLVMRNPAFASRKKKDVATLFTFSDPLSEYPSEPLTLKPPR